jgi:membrane dipeptidase
MKAKAYRNPRIQESRDVALSILKPTASELEHGLELHANSTVVDSYGFSATAAPDGQRILTAIEAAASPQEIQRIYVESMMTRMATDPAETEDFAESWNASGVTCVLRNSGEEGNNIPRMLERLGYNTYVTDQLPDIMMRATTPDDILAAKAAHKYCFYMTTNGVPLPSDQINVSSGLSYIGIFFDLGVRMMHLTYNRRNLIGEGCAETNDGGLSDFGKAVVREMNRVGVIVDSAHSSNQTGIDSASVSDKPVVISHATCAALDQHCRAKTDATMKAIADTGGFMGICCIPAFVGGSGDISAFLNHIEHAIETIGEDHVAIGTDVATHSRAFERESERIPALAPTEPRWENFWPQNDAYADPKYSFSKMIKSMAWTNWPLFTVGLVQRGYSDNAIRKIIGGNVLRVARAAID